MVLGISVLPLKLTICDDLLLKIKIKIIKYFPCCGFVIHTFYLNFNPDINYWYARHTLISNLNLFINSFSSKMFPSINV